MSESVSADPRIGTELAGYRIERLLGRGGMSVVYLAEDTRLERKVALKLLAPELSEDERFRERFLRESKLAASLDHPNVIPIYEAGGAEGVLFIAMRFVEGSDLKRLLAEEGRLEPERAVGIVERVADALDTANGQGLIHRDVKPGNVLISDAGHVYLSDFGLTKQAGSESGVTETGQFVGTAGYVAPEQIERREVSSATDEYSLACVLYECLTGAPPFRSESLMGTLFGHVNDEATPASERNPELPGEIDAVVGRGMAKKPEERYATCGELATGARAELGLVGELAIPDPARFSRRTLLVAGGLGAIAIAAAAAVPAVLLGRGSDGSSLSRVPVPGSVARLDPRTGEIQAVIPTGAGAAAVAAGRDRVWVANFVDGTVTTIDPDTATVIRNEQWPNGPGRVDRPGSGNEQVLAADDRVAWMLGVERGGIAVEFDETSERQRTVALAGRDPVGIAVGEGAVWAAMKDLGRNIITKIDPASASIVDEVELDGAPGDFLVGITLGEGSLWALLLNRQRAPLDGGQVLKRIDTTTLDVRATVQLANIEFGPWFGFGAIWLTGNTLLRVPTENPARWTDSPLESSVFRLAAGTELVWLADFDAPGGVLGIDPTTIETITETGFGFVETTPAGEPLHYPSAIAATDDAIWVTLT